MSVVAAIRDLYSAYVEQMTAVDYLLTRQEMSVFLRKIQKPYGGFAIETITCLV